MSLRFCYHIQTHRSPDQLLRLVGQIKRMSPNSLVHISHDKAGAPIDTSELSKMNDVAVQFHPGGYGDYSHIDRYVAAIDWLNGEGVQVDWLVNITGQDYPLKPLVQSENELVESGADGFLEYWSALGADSHWGARRARSRYYYRHHRFMPLSPRGMRALRPLQSVNFVQPFVRFHVAYGITLGRRVRTPFGPDLRLHGGSAFASLSWPVVDYLRAFLDRRPDVVDHFRHSLSPVEATLQTILVSAGKFNLVPDCRRYFDFRGSQFNHPRTLTLEDLPQAFASGADFARKIDGDRYPEVLDALDAQLARHEA